MMDDYEKRIVELWNKNYSMSIIAAELRVTRSVIAGKIWRMRRNGAIIPHRDSSPTGDTPRRKTQVVKERSIPVRQLMKKKQVIKVKEALRKEEQTIQAQSLNIPFWSLTAQSCRYVVNDGRPENFIFCGASKERGPYCAEHAAICYNVPNYEQRRDIKRTAISFG